MLLGCHDYTRRVLAQRLRLAYVIQTMMLGRVVDAVFVEESADERVVDTDMASLISLHGSFLRLRAASLSRNDIYLNGGYARRTSGRLYVDVAC